MEAGKILLIHTDPDTAGKITRILRQLPGKSPIVERLDEASEVLPLALVTGMRFQASKSARITLPQAQKIQESILLFCSVPSAVLDASLALLRAEGMQGILKAVLTDTNAFWNAQQLYHELCAERTSIRNAVTKTPS